MKTTFTILGKAVVLILYWTLATLWTLAVYQNYVIEKDLSSICLSIGLFSLACALHGMFISWLYKLELKRIEQKHPKTYNILSDVSVSISTIVI